MLLHSRVPSGCGKIVPYQGGAAEQELKLPPAQYAALCLFRNYRSARHAGLVQRFVKLKRFTVASASGCEGLAPPDFPFQRFYLRWVERFALEQFLGRAVQ